MTRNYEINSHSSYISYINIHQGKNTFYKNDVLIIFFLQIYRSQMDNTNEWRVDDTKVEIQTVVIDSPIMSVKLNRSRHGTS